MNFDDISKGDETDVLWNIVEDGRIAFTYLGSPTDTAFVQKGHVIWEFEFCKDTQKWMALYRYVDEFWASSDDGGKKK